MVVEGRDAALPERVALEEERLTPDEERLALDEDLDALLPVVLRRFWVLTDGRDAALPERDALEDERLTLDDERLALVEGRETLAEGRLLLERLTLDDERLAPPPYEERPALDEEDRETEDELCPAEEDPRLAADAEWPPPPLD